MSPGDIPFIRARTLSISVRLTFHAAGTVDATCNLYYSPNGNNWDTIPYTTFLITVTAGAIIQRTVPIDIPEHGYMKAEVVNGDQTYAISAIQVWYTIQSWMPYRGLEKGSILAPAGVETRQGKEIVERKIARGI